MKRLLGCVVALGVCASSAGAQEKDYAAAFGAREDVEQASLSPDGTKLSYVSAINGQASVLKVLDLADPNGVPKNISYVDGKPDRLSGCRWVGASRLMCTIYATAKLEEDIVTATRLVALDADGKRKQMLAIPAGFGVALSGGYLIDGNPGKDGYVMIARRTLDKPDVNGFGGALGSSEGGLRVDLVDTATLKSSVVERADPEAREYISDGEGHIRIVGRVKTGRQSGYDLAGYHYFYRPLAGGAWRPLSDVDENGDGFEPFGIDKDHDLAIGLKSVDGRLAAFSKSLDGSGTETLLFAHPQVDVSGFLRIGRRGRIVGATYVTDRRQVKYFDPALERLAAALAKALPDTPSIRFVDSSEDENVMLLWAGSDTNPGRYYWFDRKARKLEPLLEDRPDLRDVKLAPMQAVNYPAQDGTMIPAYLTLPVGREAKGLPALVLPHGGPSSRDEWGFDWLAQYFAAQGYAVLQPNFRGSAGYGDEWFSRNGYQNWRTAVGDVADAGKWLLAQGYADPARLGIFGWSYGGYAALQSGVIAPDLFKAIVAVAPVTDLGRLRQQGAILSSYSLRRDFIGTGAHLVEGSPARNVDRMVAPVLIFHGDMDANVDIGQAKWMQSRMEAAGKKSQLISYPGLDHQLEDSTARTDMLRRADAFLKASFGK